MDFSNTAWLQQSLADLSHVTSDGQHTTNEEWKDPSGASTAMDLGDFGLGDLSVPSPSSSSNAPPSTTPFYTFGQHTAYYPGPFNAVSYGTPQWSNAATQLPLSSYSSLNGATSTSPPSQQQSQQQTGSSSSSSMLIDPALTLNGAPSPPPQQYQHPASFIPSHALSQPQQRTQYQYSQQPQQSTFSINPSYPHTTSAHFQQSPVPRPASQQQFSSSQAQAPQVQSQSTLSPYLLQSTSLLSALPPSSFYGTPAPASTPAPAKVATPTPEQRKATLQAAIKPLLTPTSFTGAGAVSQLVRHIEDHGITEVEPSIRLEVLTKMRDNAGNHYFRAWVENEDAMDITREWLKSAYARKDDTLHLETIMPMLHIIDRLPMTLESLKASKLGKVVVRLVKDPPAPAIKDMASNLERKWRQLLVASHEDSKRMDVDDDAKGKKRKADVGSAKSAPASKKAAVSTSTSTKPIAVKKEAKAVVKEVKDAKSDSSFFSGPKPKPKLPSFKKAPPPPVKKEPDPNVAQPSSFNPFEEALKSMAKARKDSPATATPPPTAAPPMTASSSLTANGKPRKRVTWAPEGELERIKLIERAIYDDDPSDGMLLTHNVRDLDRDEGAALHAHLFEEQIEWTEPSLIELPPDIDVRPMGAESQEKDTQEQREQGALVALYVSEAQIPDSPDEPPTQLTEEQTDEGVKVMLTGPDVDAIFWTAGAPAAVEPPKQSVAELVGQLAAASGVDAFAGSTSTGAPPQSDSKPFGLDTNAIQALPGVSNLNPEQLQNLFQALSQNQSGAFQQQAPGQPAPSADWNNARYPPDYDRGGGGFHAEGPHDRRWGDDSGWAERGAGSGRGAHRGRGRGRGRGGEPYRNNKRRPCSFFAAGRCKYGDQCDFSHEPIY